MKPIFVSDFGTATDLIDDLGQTVMHVPRYGLWAIGVKSWRPDQPQVIDTDDDLKSLLERNGNPKVEVVVIGGQK